jgi:hypothetical protein
MPRGLNGNRVSITKNGKTFVASTKPPSRLVADQVFEVIDELCEQTPDPVWLVQKELADFLGVAPQTLSASINQLRADGRLEITRRGNDYGYRTIRVEAQMPLIAAITAGEHKPSTQAIADDTRAGRSRKQSLTTREPAGAASKSRTENQETTKIQSLISARRDPIRTRRPTEHPVDHRRLRQ